LHLAFDDCQQQVYAVRYAVSQPSQTAPEVFMNSAPALHFDPTQDELSVLKHIELTGAMPLATALKRHISPRLAEHGLLARGEEGAYVLTTAGRDAIRRADA
jgi:hypothetical protein